MLQWNLNNYYHIGILNVLTSRVVLLVLKLKT